MKCALLIYKARNPTNNYVSLSTLGNWCKDRVTQSESITKIHCAATRCTTNKQVSATTNPFFFNCHKTLALCILILAKNPVTQYKTSAGHAISSDAETN